MDARIQKQLFFHRKASKLQSYDSVTLHFSVKPPNSEVQLKIKPTTIQILLQNSFMSDLFIKLVNLLV